MLLKTRGGPSPVSSNLPGPQLRGDPPLFRPVGSVPRTHGPPHHNKVSGPRVSGDVGGASIGQVWTRHLAPAAPASRPSRGGGGGAVVAKHSGVPTTATHPRTT